MTLVHVSAVHETLLVLKNVIPSPPADDVPTDSSAGGGPGGRAAVWIRHSEASTSRSHDERADQKDLHQPPALDWNDEGAIQEWAQQVWEHLKAEWDSWTQDGSRD